MVVYSFGKSREEAKPLPAIIAVARYLALL